MDLNIYAEDTEEAAIKAAAEVTITAYQGIINKTPRDTGRAQNNWNVSPLKPDLSTTESTARGDERSAAENATTVALKVGGDIYIANNLPYIRPLEYGHSPISKGMVRRTIQELKALF